MNLIKSTNYVVPYFAPRVIIKSERKYLHVAGTMYENEHKLVLDQKEFNSEFDKNTYGIFKNFAFDKNKYVIAGGFLLKTIRHDLDVEDSDIDIFLIGHNIKNNLNKIIKYLEQFGELEFKEYGAVKDIRYVTCNNPDFAKLKIQFIGTTNINADEIISSFDLTYIQMYYSENVLYATVEAIDTLSTEFCKSSLYFNTNTYGNIIPFGNRIDKVIRRGYSFAFNNSDGLNEYKIYRIIMATFNENYMIVKIIAAYKSRVFTYWAGSNYGKFKKFKKFKNNNDNKNANNTENNNSNTENNNKNANNTENTNKTTTNNKIVKFKKPTWNKLLTVKKQFKFGIRRQRCNRKIIYVTNIEEINVENIYIPRDYISGRTKPVSTYCLFVYRGKKRSGEIYEFKTSSLYSATPLYCSYFQNSNTEKKYRDHGDGCSYNTVIIPKDHLLHKLLEIIELKCRINDINICYNNCNYVSKATQVLDYNSKVQTYKQFNVKVKLRVKPKNIEKLNGFRLLGWRVLMDTITFTDNIITLNIRIDIMYPGFHECMILKN